MKKYIDVLRKCPLFQGIADNDFFAMLDCLGSRVVKFHKKEKIIAEGDPARYIGIVLAGYAQVIRVDFFGNRSIVADIEPSELFGESFACADVKSIPIDVVAVEDTEVMLMDYLRLNNSCSNSCGFHQQIIYNLMKVVATKNLIFHQKLEITSKRTTREKLMTYLMIQAKKKGSVSFEIPFNRQELADYLGVDRSGLSVEIGKLCKQGMIETDKKKFKVLKSIED